MENVAEMTAWLPTMAASVAPRTQAKIQVLHGNTNLNDTCMRQKQQKKVGVGWSKLLARDINLG
jgi:hypothetical protein